MSPLWVRRFRISWSNSPKVHIYPSTDAIIFLMLDVHIWFLNRFYKCTNPNRKLMFIIVSSVLSCSKSRRAPWRLFVVWFLCILKNICMFRPFWRRLCWSRHLQYRISDFAIQKNITENPCIPSLLKIKPQVHEIWAEDTCTCFPSLRIRRTLLRSFCLCS